MTDKPPPSDRMKEILHSPKKSALPVKKDDAQGEEANCEAFGYLRGIRDSSASLELRFRGGNSSFFSYGLLGSWHFNPSEGLLLKFTSDVVNLVLIRGSNLDKGLNDGAINLTNAGLQRQRVLWIKEMTKDEIDRVGETGPTIDSIEVAEFSSYEERCAWIKKKAPAFLSETLH